MRIGNHTVGVDAAPFIVAEMSGNHNRSLERALEITDAAARAGAHALKLQTYTADTLTLDVAGGDFVIRDPGSLWNGANLHALYQEAYTPWEWHEPIADRARSLGMECFSSPFDETAVDFLEELGVKAYKIASFEIVHLPLIKKAAATGKPLIISTGMATVGEIEDAVTAARSAGCRDLMLLKCTSTYPATPENTNVLTIPHMRELFGCDVGLSDHTMGVGTAVAAVALGATLVEKHFTLRRSDGGVDSAFSLEPDELAHLVEETTRAWQSLGQVRYGPVAAESKSLQFRRSLYIVRDLQAGDMLTEENVRVVRPGFGLAPKFLDHILGRCINTDVTRGTAVHWGLIG